MCGRKRHAVLTIRIFVVAKGGSKNMDDCEVAHNRFCKK